MVATEEQITATEVNTQHPDTAAKESVICYHCGTPCLTKAIHTDEKFFCCDGCLLVYELLRDKDMCDYYKLEKHPGLTQIKSIRSDKYAYLDQPEIAAPLFQFRSNDLAIVSLYIPGIHCASCMWLLENLHKIHPGIIESRLNFSAKELTVHFKETQVSLRKIVELLATLGYEPYISLNDTTGKKVRKNSYGLLYRLGVAGFCFGNIMLMSFPEYLSGGESLEREYALLFRYLNLILSIPVFFYCSSVFFSSAWSGLKQKIVNIDAPIALALIITYGRSLYEIAMGIGNGYLDSMSGIVFFMLVGRVVQERTYRSLSFDRDYKSYFPVAVEVITPQGKESKKLQDLQKGDWIQLYHEDVIPADGIVLQGTAQIDYSFVTGESEPVAIPEGGTVYAGGKQIGGSAVIQLIKPVAGSYLTTLWNHHAFRKNKSEQNDKESFVHILSRNFTYILFVIAAITAAYWGYYDPSKILPSVTAMLIVACPCALLLAATYTHGNLMRIFSKNGVYFRDATIIEQLGSIQHIVFDKTGTLTHARQQLSYIGHVLTEDEKVALYSIVAASRHPHSKSLANWLGKHERLPVSDWKEIAGKGVMGTVNGYHIMVGSPEFIGVQSPDAIETALVVKINDQLCFFNKTTEVREAAREMMPQLQKEYRISLLSGDKGKGQEEITDLLGNKSTCLFEQKPDDKLHYISALQANKEKVLMLGDGLNDAGALQQSDVGMTLAEDVNNFTPSCDAILDARMLGKLPALLKLASSGKNIINLSFFLSVIYNVVGIYISVQAKMNPMIAAILMPSSTLTIVLITTGVSSLKAKRLGLSLK